jgi:hypothetical protein
VQPDLVAALTAMSITSPSKIQQKAIPDILAGERPPPAFSCDLTLWNERQLKEVTSPFFGFFLRKTGRDCIHQGPRFAMGGRTACAAHRPV